MNHILKETTLDNNIKVLLIDIPDSKYFDMTIAFNAGYRHSKAESSGRGSQIPHILEHMIFDGSRYFGTSDDLQTIFDKSGGESNGITTPYHNLYVFRNKIRNAEAIIAAAMDMVYFPKLSQQSFDEELQVVSNELHDQLGDFAMNAVLYNQQNVLPELPLRIDIQLQNLKKITHAEVKKYHKKYYTLDNTTIIVAFDSKEMTSQKIIGVLRKASEGAKSGKKFEPPTFAINTTKNRTTQGVKIARSIENSILSLRYIKAGTFDTAEETAKSGIKASLFTGMILNMKSYSVQHRLRKMGLTYGVSFFPALSIETYGFELMIDGPNNRFDELLKNTLRMVNDLTKNGITENQFNNLKKELIESYEDRSSSYEEIVAWYTEDYLMTGSILSTEDYQKIASSITQEDVLSFAHSVIRSENQYATVFSAKPIRKSVKIDTIADEIFNENVKPAAKTINEEINRWYSEDAEAGTLRKFAIFINTRPLLAWSWIVVELALGSFLIYRYWFIAEGNASWWYVVLALTGVLAVLEALGDTFTRYKISRRQRK